MPEFKIWCSPAAPISHFATFPMIHLPNDSLLNISSINSFKLPLRDSFPVNHVPNQPFHCSTTPLYTICRVTNNRLNSSSQFIDSLRSTIPWHHSMTPFHDTIPYLYSQTIPTVKSPKQQAVPNNKPFPQSNRSMYTICRVTDNRLNSSSQFVYPLRSTVLPFHRSTVLLFNRSTIQWFTK